MPQYTVKFGVRATPRVLLWLRDCPTTLWLSSRIIGAGPLWATFIVVGIGTIAFAQQALAERRLLFYLRFLELSVPLLVGLFIAYVLAPASDPAIELLVTYQRSLALARFERFVTLVIEVSMVVLVFNVMFALWIGRPDTPRIWELFLVWLSPAIFLGGLGAAGGLWGARGETGAIVVIAIWMGHLIMWRNIANFPSLQPVFLFLTSLTGSTENSWLINRLALLLLGGVVLMLALLAPRGEKRILDIPTISPRQWSVYRRTIDNNSTVQSVQTAAASSRGDETNG